MEEKLISNSINTSSLLTDENPNPVLMVSPAGLIMYANKSSQNLLDYLKTALGKPLPHHWINKVWETFSSLKRKDIEVNTGSTIYAVSIIPVEKEDCVHIYCNDITERKKTEEELLKAKQKLEESIIAKEKFISIMSHEIRTPMNAVVGITNLLLQEEHSSHKKEYYNALKISSESLLNILNNVLNLSKIESGKVLFEKIDFNISNTLTKLKELFAFRAAEKNIALNIHIDPKIPDYIKGDPSRLDQILVNLLSNAIKFTDEGSVIIKVELLDENKDMVHLLFSVSDTGVGIPEEKLDLIFESFTQADSDISRKYGGTGLGLTITKHLIELQGGNVDAESVLNKGSKFSFDLKFLKKRNSSKDNFNNEVEKDYSSLSGLRALVVEDNKMNQLVVSKFLHRENIVVDITENGIKALTLLKENKYDIVLMDLQMPGMDGYETAGYIRNILLMKNIPIIAFTASSSFDIENKVLNAGMNDYIVKPFIPSVFYTTIAKYTNKQIKIKEAHNNNNDMEPNSKNIDLSYLKDASGGNNKFIKEMIEIFLKQTPLYIIELKKYNNDKNWEEFRKIMHKLKPTITMMGIREGDNYVKEIDYKVKNNIETDNIYSLLDKMEVLFNKTYIELKEEINALQ